MAGVERAEQHGPLRRAEACASARGGSSAALRSGRRLELQGRHLFAETARWVSGARTLLSGQKYLERGQCISHDEVGKQLGTQQHMHLRVLPAPPPAGHDLLERSRPIELHAHERLYTYVERPAGCTCVRGWPTTRPT